MGAAPSRVPVGSWLWRPPLAGPGPVAPPRRRRLFPRPLGSPARASLPLPCRPRASPGQGLEGAEGLCPCGLAAGDRSVSQSETSQCSLELGRVRGHLPSPHSEPLPCFCSLRPGCSLAVPHLEKGDIGQSQLQEMHLTLQEGPGSHAEQGTGSGTSVRPLTGQS